VVEHFLGKEEVGGSIPPNGSSKGKWHLIKKLLKSKRFETTNNKQHQTNP
jgi:hypothetical protein